MVHVQEATVDNGLQMTVILMINCLFFICAAGNPDTECDTSEMGKLRCKFSQNINSTQTDFSVYFISREDHEELLVDCVWVNDQLQCLAQKGFECKQPVLHIAEISLPTRFVDRPGTYKCIGGSGHGNVKPCEAGKSHQTPQLTTPQKYQQNTTTTFLQKLTIKTRRKTQQQNIHQNEDVEHGNHPNDEAKNSSRSPQAVGFIAIPVIIVVLLFSWNIQKIKRILSGCRSFLNNCNNTPQL